MNPYGASRFQGHDTMSYPTQDPYESQQWQQQQQQYHHQGGSSSVSSGSVSSSVSSVGTKRARVDPTFNSDLYQDHHQLDYRSPHYSYESSTTSFASGKRQGGLADGREMMGVRDGGGAFFDTGYGSGGTVTGISSVSSARTPETAAAMIRGGGRGGSSGGLGFPSLDEVGLTGAAYPTVFGSYGGATHGGATHGGGGGGQIREFSARGTVDIGASAYLGGSGQEGGGGSRYDDMTMDGDGLEDIRGGIVGGAAALYSSAGGGVDGGVGRYGRGAAGSGASSFASNVFASGGSRRGAATSATLFGGKDGDAEGPYSGGTTSIDVSAGGLGYPDVRSGMVGGGFRNIIGNKYSRSGGGTSGGAPDRSGVGRGETGGGCTLRYDHYDGRGSYPPGSGGGAGDGDTACQGLGARSRSVVRGSAAYGVLIGPGSDSGLPVTSNSGANRNLNRIQVCDVPGDGLYGSGVGSGPHVLAPGSTGAAAVAVAVGDEDVEDKEEDSDGSDDHDDEPLAGWTEVDGWTFSELPLKGEKVGKPSSRDLSGPIHVFEGRRKPGKTGWPSGITWMVSETYKGGLEGIEWPDSLVGIVLTGFNRPVNKVSWPEGLQELHLRGPFDQAIQDARFPESLKALSFGARFNHPVEDASFPEGLEGLFFGDSDKGYERARFNQPLAGIAWPAALKQLSAGQAFQQSLEGADWPDTLEVINIMGSKKQPVEDIEWPPGLKQIHLNGRCRKEAPKAAWPRGCKVFAWSSSRKAAMAQPPKFGTTKVGLSNFSGHNMEQIMFEY
ncbi:unnamed protein product [Scytosiphon promiscuus]